MKKKAITRLDYCQYLLVSQTNYTLTNYAEHHPESISHDRINSLMTAYSIKIIVTKLNWLIANTVATPIALLKASASLTVSMSIQRPNNTGSLITVFMTKPPMAKANLTI
ncbi:hypothetical protein [Escherichia coli]|uniref:hypothetical protein n=1 Tax=Escherichia coli TaxID=562 RepID=UPI00200FFA31|nr:hypothetical protein [Escherichia coli]